MVGRDWRVLVINLKSRERPGQEGEAMESGISQEITTEGRRTVSINLDKVFLMLPSCQLLSLMGNALRKAG